MQIVVAGLQARNVDHDEELRNRFSVPQISRNEHGFMHAQTRRCSYSDEELFEQTKMVPTPVCNRYYHPHGPDAWTR